MKRACLILALTIFVAGFAIAQIAPRSKSARPANQSKAAVTSQDDGDTITFDSALVNTQVAVCDEKGRFVSGLTKDDFIVLDDAKNRQSVTSVRNRPSSRCASIDRSRSVQSV
jgi:hypothetical protein